MTWHYGDRVELVTTTDEYTMLRPGDRGTVTMTDSLGTIHVRWDCGSRLGIIEQAGDAIRRVTDPAVTWCDCGEQPRHTTRVHPKEGDPR